MALITLKFKDLVLKEFPLDEESRTIGREPGNDIVLENLLVSGYHARIDRAGKDFVLTDLQSKNGTYVNGQRVNSVKLKPGDEILIGKHTLVFALEPNEKAEDRGLAEATMFMEAPSVAASPPAGEAPADSDAAAASSADRLAVLSHLSGGGGEFELTKKLVKLGKGEEADIQVGGFLTPRVAATISRRPAGYHLTVMSGRAKVKVNGVQVKEGCRLKEFDTIEVGPARMQFYYKE